MICLTALMISFQQLAQILPRLFLNL